MSSMRSPQSAFKYDIEVSEHGRIELTVPLPPGTRVIVFVVEEPHESTGDLVAAAQSTLDFWDNPIDDEDWNDARTG